MTIVAKNENLRAARLRSGMSIRMLSKTAGLSTATVSKIENKKSMPNPSTAKKICEALNSDFDNLFEITESGKGV
ncbi:DNA-binding transcriptional regulator, XRE-family HTH domain [Natronincola peptidivorans]|uniref:DNA-binding transcriptional regulator, XRE-family HTH domain n=1 Tax=Natronincola peptidivorans TaxID=426128 RepID=A0A1I0E3F3_9FIRM|nr:helix-turn-helix transcriptional regulator [Natronincola peptidivorans]SET38712.1 DNA-binding transcriptional regulator, XRE-family HTH domain [Natronincola peptidivorans]